MNFQTLLALLGTIGSLGGGAVGIFLAILQGLLLLLRAIDVLAPTEGSRAAKRQARTSRILLIGTVLSANGWQGGRSLEADGPLLREELAFLIEEDLADVRAEQEGRKRKRARAERWAAWREWGRGVWDGVVAAVSRLCEDNQLRHGRDHEEGGGGGEVGDFVPIELSEVPLAPMTGVTSRRPSATNVWACLDLFLSLTTYLSTSIINILASASLHAFFTSTRALPCRGVGAPSLGTVQRARSDALGGLDSTDPWLSMIQRHPPVEAVSLMLFIGSDFHERDTIISHISHGWLDEMLWYYRMWEREYIHRFQLDRTTWNRSRVGIEVQIEAIRTCTK